jgi:hypothetical protein
MTLVCDNDDRSAAVLREMDREQCLVTQLRAVVRRCSSLSAANNASSE